MDRNHDWINEGKQRYSNDNLVEVDTFVSRNSSEGQGNMEGNEEIYVDYQTLNEKQWNVFKRIEDHYSNKLAGHSVEVLRIIVMGTAGTGKTYLIKGIQNRLREMTENGKESPVLVVAPICMAHQTS